MTSALSPQAVGGTHETTICSDSFSYAFLPCMTLIASVTATMENAQQVPNGCCCWIGPTAPFSFQLMLTPGARAASSSSSVKEKGALLAEAASCSKLGGL